MTVTSTDKRRIFYDFEFIEDGRTIDLISVGMVDDDGGRYYAVNELAPWERIAAHPWLMANVVPALPQLPTGAAYDADLYRPNVCGVDLDDPAVRLPSRIATDVQDFIVRDGSRPAELWAWFGAYDHVLLSQLWGPMIDHPEGVPMFTCDLRQWQAQLGDPWLPEQPESLTAHNALDDATYNRTRWHLLDGIAAGRITITRTPAGATVDMYAAAGPSNATGVQFGNGNVQTNTFQP
jgi:hypothetical protein